jgi:hypothetical protein
MYGPARGVVFAISAVLLGALPVACDDPAADPSSPDAQADAARIEPFDAGEVEDPSATFGSFPDPSSTSGSFPDPGSFPVALPPRNPPCGSDDDGLSLEQERDAGLDPCKKDTDGDGCNDGAELLLGGCDNPRQVVATNKCFASPAYRGTVQFTAPSRDAGNWTKLALIVDTSMPARVRQVGITALADDAGVARGDAGSFLSVPPGTTVRFEVQLDTIDGDSALLALQLVDENGQVLDQGKVFALYVECPLVI